MEHRTRTLATLIAMAMAITLTLNISVANAGWFGFGGSDVDSTHELPKPSIQPWGLVKPNRVVLRRTLKGYQDCEAVTGPVVDVRLEACSQTPCRVSPGQSLAMEVDFRPRDSHTNMTVRSTVQGWSPVKQTVWQEIEEELVQDGAVKFDELYTLNVPFTVPAVMGGFAHFRIELLEEPVRELCINIHVNIDLRDEL